MITFDLETLGTSYNAPVVQIAAVCFDLQGVTHKEFERAVKLTSLDKYGFSIDYVTLEWWFAQGSKVKSSVFCRDDAVNLRLALLDFIDWLGSPSTHTYWSHSTFDPPILDNNFRAVGLDNPINYRLFRDIRTLTAITGKPEKNVSGVSHNALDDCRYQACYISKAVRTLIEGGFSVS